MPNNINKSQVITTEHRKVLRVEDFDKMTLEEQLELVDYIFKKRKINFQQSIMRILCE